MEVLGEDVILKVVIKLRDYKNKKEGRVGVGSNVRGLYRGLGGWR